MVSQAAFTLLGIALFALRANHGDLPGGHFHAGAALGATLLAALGLAAFVQLQRAGLPAPLRGLSTRLARSWGWPLAAGAAGLGDALREAYARRGAFARCALVHLAAWIVGVLEVWVGLRMLGAALSFPDAVALESLVFAVRAVAFLVPAGLGVQEGAYLLLGGLLGLPPSAALALSLLKRAREVVLGVPGVLAWQVLEGRRLLGTR
jgi:putative membrane protein